MSNLTENIIETISMIAETYVREAQFDKTIQGIIISCEDEASGKYKVKYQDSIWLAYSSNLDMVYSVGTSVYVLVPGNDMARNKTILGTVKDLGEKYIEYIHNQDEYVQVGTSFTVPNSNEFGLCSYKVNDQKVLYDVNNSFNLLNIDVIAEKQYLSKSKYLILRADFRTNLAELQQKGGNYGLIIQAQFQNGSTTKSSNYILDIDSMIGNPYLFYFPLTQENVFSLEGEDNKQFKQIKKISFFSNGFIQGTSTNNDIFVSNIQLIGANEITQKQRQGTYLQITCPQGYIFIPDDPLTSTRSVFAKVMVQGRTLSSSSNDVKFYWFKQDASIDAASALYSPYGGKGWRCLNEVVQNSSNSNEKFKPGKQTINISKQEVPLERIQFQCVAVYNNNVFSNTFEMVNVNSTYLIEIISEKEMAFYSDEDEIPLTCNVRYRYDNNIITSSSLTYRWSQITENSGFNTLGSTKTVTVSALSIRNFSTYCCSAYMNGNLIGTAEVKIFRKHESSERYVLSIVNGVQLFNYDQGGNSPYIQELSNNEQLAIPALTYSIIDTTTGEEVADNDAVEKKVKWTFPLKNSLLVDKNEVQADTTTEDIKEYLNLKNFVYDISKRYFTNRTNNTIQLQVTIHEVTLKAKTNLIFTKQGQLGTNGTGIVCSIAAYDADEKIIPKSNWLVSRVSSSGSTSFSWKTLKAELWQNGQRIFSSNFSRDNITVTWEMLSLEDNSWYAFGGGPPTTQYPNRNFYLYLKKRLTASSFLWDATVGWPANIIKLTVQYNGRKYYDMAPVVTTYSSSLTDTIEIQPYCGFKYVVYSEDGENPQYDNTIPFRFMVKSSSQKDWKITTGGSIYTGHYTDGGTIYTDDVYSMMNINLRQDRTLSYPELKPLESGYVGRRFYMRPSPKYDGRCVTNYIIAVFDNSKYIHVPIHFMLNRYGHKNLNDWDGNSIKIDNKQNYILAPQIGAGTKNTENNTFTGLLMGQVADLSNNTNEIGLFAYDRGERTIFLDAQTGKAVFGKQGAGQIILDPTEDLALIKSGNYKEATNETPGSGMQIDLTTPEIKFGSGNFHLDKDGVLTTKVGHIGPWTLNEDAMYYSFPDTIVNNNKLGGVNCLYLGKDGFSLSDELIYNIQENTLKLNVSSLEIGGKSLQRTVNTYYGNQYPTTSNYPAVDWKSVKVRSQHIGDRYIDKSRDETYVYSQLSTGIKIKFSDNSRTSGTMDYVQIFFKYPKDSTTRESKTYATEKFSYNMGGTQVLIPSNDFYLFWSTTSGSTDYYGFSISSVTSYSDYIPLVNFYESSLPDYTRIEYGTNVYPSSSHNPYESQARKLYHCTFSGVSTFYSSFNWIEENNINISLAAKTATNYIYHKTTGPYSGVYINQAGYNSQTKLQNRTGPNLKLTSEGIAICQGATTLSEYTSDGIIFRDPSGNPVASITTAEGLFLKKGKIKLGSYFQVSTEGELSATNASITGDIVATSLTLKEDLSIGSNFSVDKNGLMNASGATISGTISGSTISGSIIKMRLLWAGETWYNYIDDGIWGVKQYITGTKGNFIDISADIENTTAHPIVLHAEDGVECEAELRLGGRYIRNYKGSPQSDSDFRLKQNIKILNENILNMIEKIHVYSFNWKNEKDKKANQNRYAGFIAQDFVPFEEKYKKLDYGTIYNYSEKQDKYSLYYERMIPILWKGQQQLLQKIQFLEKQLQEIKGEEYGKDI